MRFLELVKGDLSMTFKMYQKGEVCGAGVGQGRTNTFMCIVCPMSQHIDDIRDLLK